MREHAARRRVRHAGNVRRRQRLQGFLAAHLPKLPANPRRARLAGLCTLDMHARPMRSGLLRGGVQLPRRSWLSFVLPAARRSQLRHGGGLHARRSQANLLRWREDGRTGRAGGTLHRARERMHGHPRGPRLRVLWGDDCRGREISRPRTILRGRVHCGNLRSSRRGASAMRNGLVRPRPGVLHIPRARHALRVHVRGFMPDHARRRGRSGPFWLHAVKQALLVRRTRACVAVD